MGAHSLLSVPDESPGFLGLAEEEYRQLISVTHRGDDEMALLVQAGTGAVTAEGGRFKGELQSHNLLILICGLL